jgi:lincosamide nucleotidyltransferase A/C/D/E
MDERWIRRQWPAVHPGHTVSREESKKSTKFNDDWASYDAEMVEGASPSNEGIPAIIRTDQLRSILTRLHLIGVARLVDRLARRLYTRSVNLLRRLARVPLIGPGLDRLLTKIDPSGRLNFELAELLRVCHALSDGDFTYWIAGGWGLDALVGSETRRHGDLDFVLHHFAEDLPKVSTLLRSLGYGHKPPLGGTVWFPQGEVYEDDKGHHIEVLNVNWGAPNLVETLREETPGPDNQSFGAPGGKAPDLLAQFATTGELDGFAIPVLSLTAQRLFHSGYQQRPEDSHAHDIIRLLTSEHSLQSEHSNGELEYESRLGNPHSSTLLLIPIFTFPSDLVRLCKLHGNDLDLIPAHVTLAFPFLPLESVTAQVIDQLSTLFDETPAFDFALGRVQWFGTSVVYLEPSNSESFRSMTEALQRRFPAFHPYDDAFESVIPHVTLSEHGSLGERRALGRQALHYLPIEARASHAWLMSNERQLHEWTIVKIFQLGSTPPITRNDQST